MKIVTLNYSNTNTYLIKGSKGNLLFDTGWAGTYPAFCGCMGENGEKVQDIDYVLISHFHPDHMGIAQEIADEGAVIAVCDVQKDFVHSSDSVFAKENRRDYRPIDDGKVRFVETDGSRDFLSELGIEGSIFHTPGHSDDSISLLLDSGELFVGDLNPLYELEMHRGTVIEESWNMLLSHKPSKVYYGHARAAVLEKGIKGLIGNIFGQKNREENVPDPSKNQSLVASIMKYVDKGYSCDLICKKTHSDKEFVQDVMRMYLTHPGVSVQGILDRIEIKGR
ncbi:MAG: MBL fold metallo-hydrolase [Lachnospiraceae bacterium]|nr:MBL fold metallo-hydrolase [Lachnospiraceae bacterium]